MFKENSNLSKSVRLRLGGSSTQGVTISAEAGFRYVKVLYSDEVAGIIYLYNEDATEGITNPDGLSIVKSFTNVSAGTTIDLSQYTYKSFYLEGQHGYMVGYELS